MRRGRKWGERSSLNGPPAADVFSCGFYPRLWRRVPVSGLLLPSTPQVPSVGQRKAARKRRHRGSEVCPTLTLPFCEQGAPARSWYSGVLSSAAANSKATWTPEPRIPNTQTSRPHQSGFSREKEQERRIERQKFTLRNWLTGSWRDGKPQKTQGVKTNNGNRVYSEGRKPEGPPHRRLSQEDAYFTTGRRTFSLPSNRSSQ